MVKLPPESDSSLISTTTTVSAELNYFTSPTDGTKAYVHVNSDPVTGIRKKNWTEEKVIKEIANVRGHEAEYTLDSAGFHFLHEPTKLSADQFDDETVLQKVYYSEAEEIIKKHTGASKVVIFDHTIRKNHPDRKDDTPSTRTTVASVHIDQTPSATLARVHRHLPPHEASTRAQKRYQIINLWRPIRYPAFDRPLALCDFRTVDLEKDLEPQRLIYPEREGETWAVKNSERHRWKYLKGMSPDELVLIKCGDSITDGSVALCTPHTSFSDPSAPEDAKPRESIELRALVFYD